jgi:hypothetical protein
VNRERHIAPAAMKHPDMPHFLQSQKPTATLLDAFRRESSKWGLAFTMIAFTFTLKDRLAEVLASASVLLWFALNLRELRRSLGKKRNA